MIQVEGLTKFYGNIPGIQNISFRVKEGEILGFLGPNGAGKSTTMRILTGYMPPHSGRARVRRFKFQSSHLGELEPTRFGLEILHTGLKCLGGG